MTDELLIAYIDMFGEGFPTFQICRSLTDEDCAALITKCLESGKDAYEIGYCTVDGDTQY